MPDIRVMQLALDSTVLDTVLKHATSAAQRIGHIDHPAIGPLAEDIDAIVHNLCEQRHRADSHALPHVRHIVELEAIGWHLVRLRPRGTGDEPALWRVTIERYDENATMTMVDENPEGALAELVRYAQADAA